MWRKWMVGLCCLAGVAGTVVAAQEDEDYVVQRWQESETVFPRAPKPASLIPIYVSASATNRFLVDGDTLTVDADGVVRYVLVIESPQGARNVTFEGIRCESREYRIYASGRVDGSWSKSRRDDWVRVVDTPVNRYRAALMYEYFCPVGLIVRDAAEARDALLKGGHPDLRH